MCYHRAQTIACAFLSIVPTILAVEREMLESITHTLAVHCRAATWLANGLKIEEVQISLCRNMKRMASRAIELQQLALAC